MCYADCIGGIFLDRCRLGVARAPAPKQRSVTPLYFFNIRDGRDVFDTTGTELANFREIRVHMMATAAAVVEEEGASEGSWDMEVLDERGKIVASMDVKVETKI